jgi:hypothetical protein
MWRGTGGTTLGASRRQLSPRTRAGRLGERTTPASNTGAAKTTRAVGLDVSDCLRSDIAQQASASACVSTCADRDPSRVPPLCIGQSASAQHSIRASGVAAQPAHRAPLAPKSARVSAKARACRNRPTTSVGCSTADSVSNQDPSGLLKRPGLHAQIFRTSLSRWSCLALIHGA